MVSTTVRVKFDLNRVKLPDKVLRSLQLIQPLDPVLHQPGAMGEAHIVEQHRLKEGEIVAHR